MTRISRTTRRRTWEISAKPVISVSRPPYPFDWSRCDRSWHQPLEQRKQTQCRSLKMTSSSTLLIWHLLPKRPPMVRETPDCSQQQPEDDGNCEDDEPISIQLRDSPAATTASNEPISPLHSAHADEDEEDAIIEPGLTTSPSPSPSDDSAVAEGYERDIAASNALSVQKFKDFNRAQESTADEMPDESFSSLFVTPNTAEQRKAWNVERSREPSNGCQYETNSSETPCPPDNSAMSTKLKCSISGDAAESSRHFQWPSHTRPGIPFVESPSIPASAQTCGSGKEHYLYRSRRGDFWRPSPSRYQRDGSNFGARRSLRHANPHNCDSSPHAQHQPTDRAPLPHHERNIRDNSASSAESWDGDQELRGTMQRVANGDPRGDVISGAITTSSPSNEKQTVPGSDQRGNEENIARGPRLSKHHAPTDSAEFRADANRDGRGTGTARKSKRIRDAEEARQAEERLEPLERSPELGTTPVPPTPDTTQANSLQETFHRPKELLSEKEGGPPLAESPHHTEFPAPAANLSVRKSRKNGKRLKKKRRATQSTPDCKPTPGRRNCQHELPLTNVAEDEQPPLKRRKLPASREYKCPTCDLRLHVAS
ncbi:hypothetical protein NA57DRAFT_62247 [Rhizodiscina lignyota]|uniref:Uncharacterized protein n=1 Tax=Rhizodiscina lignyota TaxID=1504668 RepID=A0A9P4M4C8_9PEZI|nr:hypothetical protein NA57DRAFT_62247 [Rhizodiscina lignyota]